MTARASRPQRLRFRRRRAASSSLPLAACLLALVLLPMLTGGCASPSKANIELRKQNADLRSEIESLRRLREADQATIRALESAQPTVERLPAERLAMLFTTHGIALGRLTGGLDQDPDQPGHEALRVVVTPQDEAGHSLKAAGSFVIEAFDLALNGDSRIGQWQFDLTDARQRWYGAGLMYGYVFELPWQRRPEHAELTIKVSFTDALTGRTYTVQKVVTVSPPPAAPSADQREPEPS